MSLQPQTSGQRLAGGVIPELTEHYFYSDYCGGYLRSLRIEDGAVNHADWADQVGMPGQVVSFGVNGAGEMYVLITVRSCGSIPVR